MEQPNIDAQVSIRGLTEGGFETPLRRFKGRYVGLKTEPITDAQGNTTGKIRVILQYSDVEVIDSTEPYNFPTAEIRFSHSLKKGSKWGIFSESLVKLLPEDEDLNECKGKMMELVYTPDHDFGENRDTGERIVSSIWEVASIEGGGAKVNPIERALELLDGKTIAEFNQVVFSDPAIKGDVAFGETLLDDSFIKSMLDSGKVTKNDDGVCHVKKEG